MNEDIEKAVDDLVAGDAPAFIDAMKGVLDAKLAEDETFQDMTKDLEAYADNEDED